MTHKYTFKLIPFFLGILFVLSFTTTSSVAMPPDPKPGDFKLLEVLEKLSSKNNHRAMQHFPVPFVILTQATNPNNPEDTVEIIDTFRSGSPKRIDIDNSRTTGKGGHDIEVIVEQILGPPFQLQLTINRLDPPSGRTAQDLSVIVAFPTNAFNSEILDAPPYLFLGYSTRVNEPEQSTFIPLSEQVVFTPNIVGGTLHDIALTLNSRGTPDSVLYLSGFYQNQLILEPPPPNASLIDLATTSVRMSPVPAATSLSLNTAEIFSPTPNLSEFSLNWNASEQTQAIITYEDNVGKSGSPDLIYTNVITVDQMPTQETLSVDLDLANTPPTFSLTHSGNSKIGELSVERTQTDGNANQACVFIDVPTNVDLTLKANIMSATFGPKDDVANSPKLGSAICDFYDEGGLLGSAFKRAQGKMVAVPDFSIQWDVFNATPSVTAGATNPDDHIGFIGMAMATGNIYPELWDPNPSSHPGEDDFDHVLAFEEDEEGFRFATGFGQLKNITFNLDANTIDSAFDIESVGANHLNLALLIDKNKATVLPTKQNIDVTCEMHDVPQRMSLAGTNFADQWNYTASDNIESIACSGMIDSKEFTLALGDLPTTMNIDYQADNHLNLTVPTGEQLGLFDLFCHDPEGIDNTDGFFKEELRYAHGRLEDAPTLTADWTLATKTFSYNFDTPNPNEVLGLIKVAGALNDITIPSGAHDSIHYAYFVEQDEEKEFGVQLHKIDSIKLNKNSDGQVNFNMSQSSSFPLSIFWNTNALSELTGPNKAISATVHINDVPTSMNFSSDLRSSLSYTATEEINRINLTADIGLKQSNDSLETTHIDGLLAGLPTETSFSLIPRKVGSATLTINNPIDQIRLELTSDVRILENPYRHILIDAQDISDSWVAEWDMRKEDEGQPHASFNSNHPLGFVSIIVSKDLASNTPEKYDLFTSPGGAIQYSAFAREIDRRYYRKGDGSVIEREAVFMGRLDGNDGQGGIYGTTTMLDPGEDHLVYLKNEDGKMDFLSMQGIGLQCLSFQLKPGSFQCIETMVNADEMNASLISSIAEQQPFYVAIEESTNEFLTVQIEDVPDTASVIVGKNRAHIDFSDMPGDVVVYKGMLPSTHDGQEALKVIVTDTPSYIHMNWNLGFPGDVHVDSSNPFNIAFLNQDSNDRTIINVRGRDLDAKWGYETLEPTIECEDFWGIPIACSSFIVFVKAFVEFKATPGIDGFINIYEYKGSLQEINPAGPAHLANEFIPKFSMLMKGYQKFDASAGIKMCIVPVVSPLPPHPNCIVPGPFTPMPFLSVNNGLTGNFELDWWDDGGDFLGDPDYIANEPWHLYPLLHNHDNHLLPFSGASQLDNDYPLMIHADGFGNGTVTLIPKDDKGKMVTLVAIPDEGSYFTGWTGDVMSSDDSIDLIIDDSRNITAKFEHLDNFPFQIYLPFVINP